MKPLDKSHEQKNHRGDTAIPALDHLKLGDN